MVTQFVSSISQVAHVGDPDVYLVMHSNSTAPNPLHVSPNMCGGDLARSYTLFLFIHRFTENEEDDVGLFYSRSQCEKFFLCLAFWGLDLSLY